MRRTEKCHFSYWFLLPILALTLAAQLAGCAAVKESQNPAIFSYTYLSFNFSGKGWDAARARCASQGKKANHLATNCGFWTCTTEVKCVDEAPASD